MALPVHTEGSLPNENRGRPKQKHCLRCSCRRAPRPCRPTLVHMVPAKRLKGRVPRPGTMKMELSPRWRFPPSTRILGAPPPCLPSPDHACEHPSTGLQQSLSPDRSLSADRPIPQAQGLLHGRCCQRAAPHSTRAQAPVGSSVGTLAPRAARGKAAAAAAAQQQQPAGMALRDKKPIELENGWRYMEVRLACHWTRLGWPVPGLA